MAKFADYGFNRSHSMAYALLAFQTAYLKAHYPAYFYAAVLSHEAQDSAKVYKYSTELRSMGLKLLPPDINESDDGFTPVADTVRYGLTAIKGMGSSSVAAIVEARKSGRFTSLYDFCGRLGAGAVNRRGLESLISAGAFDSLMPDGETVGSWRAKLFAAIDPALQQGQRLAEDRLNGQNALFGAAQDNTAGPVEMLPDAAPWSGSEVAKREKAAVGFYLSTHPLDNYTKLLSSLRLKNIAEIEEPRSGETVCIAGMVGALQIRTSKKGNRFATFRLEDRSGGIKCLVIGENFNRLAQFLTDDQMFIADGRIEAAEGQEPTLMVNDLKLLDEAEANRAREVNIRLPESAADQGYLEGLYALLERDRGRCGVSLTISAGDTLVTLQADGLSVAGSRVLQHELESRGCVVDWIH